jgi:aryl-alcohol dehydrogenase-like predicted oxidoreductase
MSWNRSFVPDRDKMVALIRKAYDMGVNLFDTAEAYGPYVNEELVGEAIAPFRKNITLCAETLKSWTTGSARAAEPCAGHRDSVPTRQLLGFPAGPEDTGISTALEA